jgi:hypothetical protein
MLSLSRTWLARRRWQLSRVSFTVRLPSLTFIISFGMGMCQARMDYLKRLMRASIFSSEELS